MACGGQPGVLRVRGVAYEVLREVLRVWGVAYGVLRGVLRVLGEASEREVACLRHAELSAEIRAQNI